MKEREFVLFFCLEVVEGHLAKNEGEIKTSVLVFGLPINW